MRRERNITQESLESEFGGHTGYLSRVEAGAKDISISRLIEIAVALNIDVYFGEQRLTPLRKQLR